MRQLRFIEKAILHFDEGSMSFPDHVSLICFAQDYLQKCKYLENKGLIAYNIACSLNCTSYTNHEVPVKESSIISS